MSAEVDYSVPAAGERLGDLTGPAARDLTDRIRAGLEGVYELIKSAYRGRVWIGLGYGSWDEYVTREFGNLQLQPPKEDRNEVLQSMKAAGMSVRAIASGTGLSVGTVYSETSSGVQNRTPGQPTTVQGQDGKTYPARQPTRPTPPPKPSVQEDSSESVPEPLTGQSSIEDVMDENVLDRPAADFGITPLDMEARAGAEKERVSRVLREFDGSGSAVLPMTIKLASQVAGLVSPLTGESSVPDERLHEAAFSASRAVRTLTNVLAQLKARLDGENGLQLRINLQDTVDELDRLLAGAEAGR